jgi:hypothetical protein
MAGKFEVYTDAGGKFRLRLKAATGKLSLSARPTTRKPPPLKASSPYKRTRQTRKSTT